MKRRGFLALLVGLPAVAKKLPAMLAAGSAVRGRHVMYLEWSDFKVGPPQSARALDFEVVSTPGRSFTHATIRGLEPWEFDRLAMKEVELAKKSPSPKGLEDLLR